MELKFLWNIWLLLESVTLRVTSTFCLNTYVRSKHLTLIGLLNNRYLLKINIKIYHS